MVGQPVRTRDALVFSPQLVLCLLVEGENLLFTWEVGKALSMIATEVDYNLWLRFIFKPYLVDGGILEVLAKVDVLKSYGEGRMIHDISGSLRIPRFEQMYSRVGAASGEGGYGIVRSGSRASRFPKVDQRKLCSL